MLGFGSNFTIYDADDQKTVMKEIFRKFDINTKIYKERGVLAEISHAKDELITPEEMELNAGGDPDARKIAGMYKEYQSILRGNNALDFDDLIVKTVELFQHNPDILDYYQERFKYIMVDEYQDTNTAQFKFVSLLAEKYKNLCVVGDDDQSIYRFRGANIGNILGFEKVFPEAKVVRLSITQSVRKNASGQRTKRAIKYISVSSTTDLRKRSMLQERSSRGAATGNSSTGTVQYFIGPMPSPVSLRRNFSWQMFLIRLSAA